MPRAEAICLCASVESYRSCWGFHMGLCFAKQEELASLWFFNLKNRILGFDYRDCARRFLGGLGPASCAFSRSRLCRSVGSTSACLIASSSASLWPHRQFANLATRQPWACGVLCHFAAAFAHLAEANLQTTSRSCRKGARPFALSEDQVWLIKSAQEEILQAEAIFWAEEPSHQVQLTCSLVEVFPIFILLSRLAGFATPYSHLLSMTEKDDSVEDGELRTPNQPPPPTLAKLCDKLNGWPPTQRLTSQGSFVVYSLLHALGSLLDHFQVRWWMSSGALLGTCRNAGMLPQDCDVDIALWRPDAHILVKPAFKAALAAAGIVSYHMPIYFQYRFCLVQVPAAADVRSVQGGLACHLPYIDAHLADVAQRNAFGESWHYIHRTDLQYAYSFPLEGVLKWSENTSSFEDRRQRMSFGGVQVWIPRREFAEDYLSKVYGNDWRTALRGRYGKLICNRSQEEFRGFIAQPTGPLRDVLQECLRPCKRSICLDVFPTSFYFFKY